MEKALEDTKEMKLQIQWDSIMVHLHLEGTDGYKLNNFYKIEKIIIIIM